MSATGNADQLRCKFCNGPVGSEIKGIEAAYVSGPVRRDEFYYCINSCDTSQLTGDCGHSPRQLPS